MQGVVVAIEDKARRIYALQYHPEVRHSLRGDATLKHFLYNVAEIIGDWKIENVLEEELEKLRRVVSLKEAQSI